MTPHKNKIRHSFNRAAATYDQGSYPQQIIGSNLIHTLGKYMTTGNNVIDLGCGSGIITEQLARYIKYQTFYAIDISEYLIAHAAKRLEPFDIRVLLHDFEQTNFTDIPFDLVFSNMALHWSSDFFINLLKIQQSMSHNGLVAFTIPLEGTFSELNATSRNDFLALIQIKEHMQKIGFEIMEAYSDQIIFSYSSRLNTLKSIRATGANYLINRVTKSLANRPQLNSSQHQLSYNIGYFIGRKTHLVT